MYDAILITDELRGYLPFLCRILKGEGAGLKPEKLNHNGDIPIYALRVSQSTRLLYITAKVNSKHALVVIDEIVSHDYHKSPFLRGKGVLPAYLKKFSASIKAALSEPILEKNDETMSASDKTINLEIDEEVKQGYYSLKQFGTRLFFEDESQEASIKEKHANTLIITGSSGTGKTVSAMLYLSSFVGSTHSDGALKKYMYVSANHHLVEDVQKQLQAALAPEKFHCIDFKTYADLVLAERGDVATSWTERASIEHFILAELNRYKKDWALFGEALDKTEAMQVIHDELTLLFGLAGDLSAYQALGDDQSYIKKEHRDTRAWVHGVYSRLSTHLEKNNEVYLPFYTLSKHTLHYDDIIIDEAFLLSFANVLSLGTRSNFRMLLGDSHQAIGAHWLSVFTSRQLGGVSYIRLKDNFRNPSSVIDVLNRVLQVKYYIRPGLRDKHEQGRINPSDARTDAPILWINPAWCENNQSVMNQWTASSQFVVVMLCDEQRMAPSDVEEKKERLRKRFNTPLIFTRQEIQGLEYPVVAVAIDSSIDPIACMLTSDFVNGIRQKDAAPTTRSDSKGVSFRQQKAIDISSQLYVGFSRAQHQLVVYLDEELANRAQSLVAFYQHGVESVKEEQSEKQVIIEVDTSKALWEEEQERQAKRGNAAIVKRIAKQNNTHVTAPKQDANRAYESAAASKGPLTDPALKQESQDADDSEALRFKAPVEYTDKWKEFVKKFKATSIYNHVNIENIICKAKNDELMNWLLFGAEVEEGTGDSIFIRYVQSDSLYDFMKGLDSHLNRLSKASLNMLLPASTGEDAGKSMLYFITAMCEGMNILSSHPYLIKKISAEAFNARLPETAGVDTGKSPVIYFCCTDAGRELLISNPDLVKKISSSTFNAPLPKATGVDAGKTPVYALCGSSKGLELLGLPNGLINKISSEALNIVLPESTGIGSGVSSALCLCTTPMGRELLKLHPELAQKISSETLNIRLPKTAGRYAGHSCAYYLCTTLDGQELLRSNPVLLEKLSQKTLHTRFTDLVNMTLLEVLALSEVGRSVLEMIPAFKKSGDGGHQNFGGIFSKEGQRSDAQQATESCTTRKVVPL